MASSPVILGPGEHRVLAVHGWVGSAGGRGSLRFSLIGHSMGGKVAHQVLLQAPHRVRKLVDVNFTTGSRQNGAGVPVKVIVGETDPALSAAVMEQTRLPATSIERFPGRE